MKKLLLSLSFSTCALLFALLVSNPAETADTITVSSSQDERISVSLTIYNVNLGLVKDVRKLSLPAGVSEVRFMDVASRIIPASVSIRSMNDPAGLMVLEQNYEYDLLSPQKLLDKYVGKEVKLFTSNPYTGKEEVVTASLLSNNNGPIYRIGSDITFGHPGRVLFPGLPESLIAKPTLVWLLSNKSREPLRVEATYLTEGITWRADYVLTLAEKDDRADISGWVTIENKSGTAYRDSKLKLVAGDVNRVRDDREVRERVFKMAAAPAPAAADFKEEEFFEYHLYTLQRPSTLKDNQTKQISLVAAADIPVAKELVLRGENYYYFSQHPDPITNMKVGVFVELRNRKESNLGIPLPKGIVRVYKNDADGSLQFIGEDRIDHTPKDEKIRIRLGNAFDVVGTRKQMEWKKIGRNVYETSFEIALRNHKKEDVTVKVVEPIPGDWTMLSASHPHRKTQAHIAEFDIPVKKDAEAKLTYSVRLTY